MDIVQKLVLSFFQSVIQTEYVAKNTHFSRIKGSNKLSLAFLKVIFTGLENESENRARLSMCFNQLGLFYAILHLEIKPKRL